MAKLQMFPVGEDKKQYAKRQALHDEQLRQEQLARERTYPATLSREEWADRQATDTAEAEAADAAAIAASPNYLDPQE